MRTTHLLLGAGGALAAMLLLATPYFVRAQTQAPAAVTGQVSSEAEGAMEGVVVSAKKAGSTVTVSVISDAHGRYGFPGRTVGAGTVFAQGSRGRLRPCYSHKSGCRRRADRHRRSQTSKTQESRRPAQQCRMDDEHARYRGAEGLPARLHGLPHA